jgi:hypothetical protein
VKTPFPILSILDQNIIVDDIPVRPAGMEKEPFPKIMGHRFFWQAHALHRFRDFQLAIPGEGKKTETQQPKYRFRLSENKDKILIANWKKFVKKKLKRFKFFLDFCA